MSDTLNIRGGGIVVHVERVRGGVVVPMLGKDGQPVEPQVVVPVDFLGSEPRAALLAAAAKAADEIERVRALWEQG